MRCFQINITSPFRIQIKMVNKTRNIEVITVQFNVDCKTKFGETVFICGSCQQLGHWTPHNGLMLQTNRRNYPEWTTSRPLMMRSNQMIEFKICIIKESTVIWENLLQNRVFFIGSRPLQIYVDFNNDFMQIHQKKVVQMDCRNGIEAVTDEMQSQWGSSIGHPSNYPLQRFHMGQRGQIIGNKSNISSNLMSICDDDELEFQLKIMNYLNPVTLSKSTSRPYDQLPFGRQNNLFSQTSKIISLHSQTPNPSPQRRIFSSLPKKITNTEKKAPFQPKLSQKFSFFNINHKHSQQQTNKTNTLNSESLPSDKKINSDQDTFKRSPISKNPSSSSDGDSFQNGSVEEMFGLEMF